MTTYLPAYYQIKQIIRSSIINKEYEPGAKISSENELANQFKVSRVTVRQAISQLAKEGFLISRRGHGTYVTTNQDLINSFSLEFTGFIDDLFHQVQKSKTKSVEILNIPGPKLIMEKLKLDPGNDKEILLVKRVRYLRDQSFAYTVNYLPLEIGKHVSEEELYQKPLRQILKEKLRIQFGEAFQTIEASFAGQEVGEKLGIELGSPILLVERIMYDTKGKPIEIVQSSYRGDVYKYVIRLKTMSRKNETIWVHQSG